MTQFTKDKITFAIALIAVLFALQPFITNFQNQELLTFGLKITVEGLYVTMSLLLFAAIYFYALEFIRETPLGFGVTFGNYLYVLALVLPIVAVFAVAAKYCLLGLNLWNQTATNVLVVGLAAGGGIGSVALAIGMSVKDIKSRVDQLDRRELEGLKRGVEAMASGLFGVAVIEIFEAATSSLRKLATSYGMAESGSSIMRLSHDLRKRNLISDKEEGDLKDLIHLRNVAAHSSMDTLRVDAERSLEIARRIMNSAEQTTKSVSGDKIPVSVSDDGSGAKQIMVPANKSGALQKYLGKNGIQFTVTSDAVRSNGMPALDVLHLNDKSQTQRVEELLAEWKA